MIPVAGNDPPTLMQCRREQALRFYPVLTTHNSVNACSLQNCVTDFSGGLLRSDSFGPFGCFRVGLLRLYDSVAHDTTMQRRPARKEERFTRRLRLTETEAGKTPNNVFASVLFFLL